MTSTMASARPVVNNQPTSQPSKIYYPPQEVDRDVELVYDLKEITARVDTKVEEGPEEDENEDYSDDDESDTDSFVSLSNDVVGNLEMSDEERRALVLSGGEFSDTSSVCLNG